MSIKFWVELEDAKARIAELEKALAARIAHVEGKAVEDWHALVARVEQLEASIKSLVGKLKR